MPPGSYLHLVLLILKRKYSHLISMLRKQFCWGESGNTERLCVFSSMKSETKKLQKTTALGPLLDKAGNLHSSSSAACSRLTSSPGLMCLRLWTSWTETRWLLICSWCWRCFLAPGLCSWWYVSCSSHWGWRRTTGGWEAWRRAWPGWITSDRDTLGWGEHQSLFSALYLVRDATLIYRQNKSNSCLSNSYIKSLQ